MMEEAYLVIRTETRKALRTGPQFMPSLEVAVRRKRG
jgi:hypothetical protein